MAQWVMRQVGRGSMGQVGYDFWCVMADAMQTDYPLPYTWNVLIFIIYTNC